MASVTASRNDDSGGHVGQAYAGIGHVLMLSSGASGPETVDAALREQIPVTFGDGNRGAVGVFRHHAYEHGSCCGGLQHSAEARCREANPGIVGFLTQEHRVVGCGIQKSDLK